MSGKWTVKIGEPDYLDGIQSGVTVYGPRGHIVAYAFDAKEGAMLAAAPTMAEALENAEAALSGVLAYMPNLPTIEAVRDQCRAALAQAQGDRP